MELFRNTEEFYNSVARARMAEELNGVASSALYDLKDGWGIGRDLYEESIKNNIKYMKEVTVDCADSYDCIIKKTRRNR